MLRRTLTLVIAATSVASCDAGARSVGRGPDVVVETRGDTTVVRTLSGSVWGADARLVPQLSIGEVEGPEELLFGGIGSIAVDDGGRVYVLDRQALNVRVFDSAGEYIETLGGPGEGPGELSSAESVMLLADGRVAVDDQLDRRVQLYRAGRGETEVWPYSAGIVIVGSRQQLYADRHGRTFVVVPQFSSVGDFVRYVIVPLDSNGVPQDTLLPPGGDFEPPSVELELDMDSGPARTISPAIPLTARHYWTLNEDYDPDNPRSDPVTWPSPLRYDVFDPDGTYLGAVVPPEGFADYPQPIFAGDDVWAVTRDDLGVERVVRFRLEVGGGNR